MNILRMCFDWRVVTGLAAGGVGIFLVAPGIAAAALPLLILAACPLSMMLMMKSMGGAGHEPPPSEAAHADGADRVTALRGELAELGRRQERLAAELATIDPGEARASSSTSDAPATQQAR